MDVAYCRGEDMDIEKYCALLVHFKNNGISFSSYMGVRWLISKVVILTVGILMAISKERAANMAGYILLGYLLGVVSANIRSFVISKKTWIFQKEVIDWGKIEGILKQEAQ